MYKRWVFVLAVVAIVVGIELKKIKVDLLPRNEIFSV